MRNTTASQAPTATTLVEEQLPQKEKAFSSIGARSFVSVVLLLCAVLLLAGLLSYFVPQGAFERVLDEEGRELIIPGTYTSTGEKKGIALWRVLTAPVRVFASEDSLSLIMICVFLLVMSGIFNLLEKTHGIHTFISRLMRRLADKGGPVVCICVLIFMLFGSFFGMFEELVTLLPLITVFMLSMNMDTMTGMGACMLAACFGFSAAITNPFSVGIAADMAGTSTADGVWLRLVFFGMIYLVLCVFLMGHLRRIEKDPTLSPTYESDLVKRASLDTSSPLSPEMENKTFRVYTVFFAVQALMLVLIATVRSISGLAIPLLAASFLICGTVCGLIVAERKRDVARYIGQGVVAMLPAVVMIAIASSVKLVMTESGIIDTLMNFVIRGLVGKGKFLCILLIYLLILVLQLFIGSASAKIFLVMPIIFPICQTLGLSPTVVILAYCMADGFTDVILPTNPVLLVGLSMANVSYGKWVKWTWKLQLLLFGLSLGVLFLATQIGY